MARRGRALGVVAALATLLLAACSSSDGDAQEVAPTTVTTAVATTETPTTTNAPTTTAAPTTTIDPADELAAAVEADFREADRLGREASMDPFDTAKEAAALDRRLGVIRENFAAKLADWRERTYALRANEEVPASVTIEGELEFLGDAADVARIQVCEVNSWILVEVGAGPDGGDAIVDPEVVTYRNEYFLRSVDGIWRIEGGNELESFTGGVECPDE